MAQMGRCVVRPTVRIALISLVVVYSLAAPAVGTAVAQQLITTCGASKGKAYNLEPKKDAWVDDGISGGTITFVRYPTGEYDVIVKHSMGSLSAREDGAKVVKANGSSDNVMTLVVSYPLSVTEIYQLTLDARGRGTLLWSNHKNRSGPLGVTRAWLFVAECSR